MRSTLSSGTSAGKVSFKGTPRLSAVAAMDTGMYQKSPAWIVSTVNVCFILAVLFYSCSASKANAWLSSDSIKLSKALHQEASPLSTLQHQQFPEMARWGLPRRALPRKKGQARTEVEDTVTPAAWKWENVTDACMERQGKGFSSEKHKKNRWKITRGQILHVGWWRSPMKCL